MSLGRHLPSLVLALTAAGLLVACGGSRDATRPEPTGDLRVAAATTGEDLDPDGLTVTVDGRRSTRLEINGAATVRGLSAGRHRVELAGVAANCTVGGPNPRSVTVSAGDTARTSYSVECVPRTGDLEVSAATSGADPDPDGYTVTVDASDSASVAPNGSVTFSDRDEADHPVELSGVAANCRLQGENPRTVGVEFGSTARTTFEVTCRQALFGGIAYATGPIRPGGPGIVARGSDGTGSFRVTAGPGRSPAVSPDGTRIAFVSHRDGDADIYVIGVDGAGLERLTDHPGHDEAPTWSPDGKRIAFASDRDGDLDVYVAEADGTGLTRLTDDPARDGEPAWSPGGSAIAFTSDRDGNDEIYVSVPGQPAPGRLTRHPARDEQPSWSPDGTRIAFESNRAGNCNDDIFVMSADGTDVTRLTTSPAADRNPAWRSRVAFTSDRGGNFELFSIRPDGTGRERLTSRPAADYAPAWGPTR